MKKIGLLILIFGLTLSSCKQKTKSVSEADNQMETLVENDNSTSEYQAVDNNKIHKALDSKEIESLIREVLKWADSDKSIDLLPVTSGDNDSIYTGIDKDKLKQNIVKLTNSNLFSNEFIENYNQIILTLDQRLKNNDFEYGPWYVGDMPPFNFASGANPWCQCQDNMDWNLVEVEQINDNEFQWKWGGLKEDTHQSWKDFRYTFNVTQEDSKWKISYLEGFNINEIKK